MKDEGSEHYTRGHYRRDAAQAFYLLASIIIQMVFRLVGMAMVAQDLDMNANRCPPTAWPEGGGLWHAEFVTTAIHFSASHPLLLEQLHREWRAPRKLLRRRSTTRCGPSRHPALIGSDR